MNALLRVAVICAAELRAEWRSLRASIAMLLLGVLGVLTFAFAGEGSGLGRALPAYWVSILLAASAGSALWASRSGESGVGLAIALGPSGTTAAFFGRLFAFGLVLLAVGALLAVVTAALFDVLGPRRPMSLVGSIGLGILGLAALGAAVQPFLLGPRARLGPLLYLPLGAPVLLLAARASEEAYLAVPDAGSHLGLGLLVFLLLLFGGLLPMPQPGTGG